MHPVRHIVSDLRVGGFAFSKDTILLLASLPIFVSGQVFFT